MAIASGLVSISFRTLSVNQIIAAVVQAGLDGIEWGGDVHVPHGDMAQAKATGAKTRDAGLHVAAYGSYYRVGVSEQQGLPFEKVLDSAVALQAPVIRVWAGNTGSADSSPDNRTRIVEDGLRIGHLARKQGIAVAFEYHCNTLTDTRASALALLQATQAAELAAYWQPTVGWSHKEHLASLRDMLPWLANLHVYRWTATGLRQALSAGRSDWRDYFALAAEAPSPAWIPTRWAMLEFVMDNSLAQFARDAAVLKQLLKRQSLRG